MEQRNVKHGAEERKTQIITLKELGKHSETLTHLETTAKTLKYSNTKQATRKLYQKAVLH